MTGEELSEVPTALYKYVTPPRADILETLRIRFTQPTALNDVFEMTPLFVRLGTDEDIRKSHDELWPQVRREAIQRAFSALPPHLQQLVLNSPEFQARMDNFMVDVTAELARLLEKATPTATHQVRTRIAEYIGALSFSEIWDNLVMWAHYAQQHEGLVIEFDPSHQSLSQKRSADDELGFVRRVRYHAKRPQLVLSRTEGADVFLAKSDVWAYEREWRVLRHLSELAQSGTDPSGRPVYLGSVDPACIRSVIFGLRTAPETRKHIVRLVRETPTLRHITLWRTEPTETEYALSRSQYKENAIE